ncbi:conserved hypothetical protein [Pediculus humanus corporis]|uniref:Uncharacterized protein n=1 Tax=Pediculus humanus subsp. corporis TaxID=121224 RepID=E0VAM1_PEDHC|nr:uncharacterized protein Phum_PHUM041000 [Pediculus humanus corporis]EEB10427.1 conserved hypothetical protein [Pediculus humanus corporis]
MGSTAPEYFRQLCHQVEEKEKQKLQKLKEEEVESHRHFETWQGFWGRPGHGAPKALSQREKLELLLYRVPSRRLVSTQPPKIQ